MENKATVEQKTTLRDMRVDCGGFDPDAVLQKIEKLPRKIAEFAYDTNRLSGVVDFRRVKGGIVADVELAKTSRIPKGAVRVVLMGNVRPIGGDFDIGECFLYESRPE